MNKGLRMKIQYKEFDQRVCSLNPVFFRYSLIVFAFPPKQVL